MKTSKTLFEKCKRIYGLKIVKSEFKKAGTLQLTGIRRIAGKLLCVRAAGADGSGRWIFVVDDFFSLFTLY